MTTEHTNTDQAAQPIGVGSSEGLGAWVRVTDRLPALGVDVLAFGGPYKVGSPQIAVVCCDETPDDDEGLSHGWFVREQARTDAKGRHGWVWYYWGQATHWMPLPAPPQSA